MSELSQLEKQIARLQKRADALRAKKNKTVIIGLVRQMREYDISPEEIAAAFGSKGKSTVRVSRGGTVKKATRAVVTPKYRHPETQATWTGRGKAPRWITDAEAAGASRDTFLIAPQAAEPPTAADPSQDNLQN